MRSAAVPWITVFTVSISLLLLGVFAIITMNFASFVDQIRAVDQDRLVMGADQVCELSLAGLVERWDAQFEQFVMVERRVDFPVQVFGQSFLAYDDHRL